MCSAKYCTFEPFDSYMIVRDCVAAVVGPRRSLVKSQSWTWGRSRVIFSSDRIYEKWYLYLTAPT
jgi:hypothetical protein